MDGKTILSIKKCGDLFSNDKMKIKMEFRSLAKKYHPDVNKDPLANEIFAKINFLYNKSLDMIYNNEWEVSNVIEITKSNNEKLRFNYLKEKNFELGKMYICSENIIYILRKENKKYYDNFIKQINKIRYRDSKMEKEFSRLFPKVIKTFETNKNEYCIILSKKEDVYLLSDLLEFYNNKIPDKHVAWIISRLLNICCYLYYIGITHNGISIDNCFVSPKNHSILLLGGWWYSCNAGSKMIGTQKDIFNIMSIKDKSNKTSSFITDLESVKQIGRKCINKNLNSLIEFKKEINVPKPFLDFLFSGSSMNSIEEFCKWNKVLDKSYGERKFIKMEISNNDIYK